MGFMYLLSGLKFRFRVFRVLKTPSKVKKKKVGDKERIQIPFLLVVITICFEIFYNIITSMILIIRRIHVNEAEKIYFVY